MAATRAPKDISIRWSIFRTLLLLIFLISGSLLVVTAFTATRSIQALSEKLITEAAEVTKLRLTAFFAPVTDNLSLLETLIERGRLDPRDREQARMFFTPLLEHYPQTAAIFWGSATGEAGLVSRLEGEWLDTHVPEDKDAPQTTSFFSSSDGAVYRTTETPRYDPRERPWYQLAKSRERGEVVWTPPYRFLTGETIGITGAIRIATADGTELVLAMDVALTRLLEYMQEIRPTPGGRAFLLTQDGQILTANHLGPLAEVTPREVGAEDIPAEALIALASASGKASEVVRHGSEWWCGLVPFRTQAGQVFQIGVIIPQRDLVGGQTEFRLVLLFVTLGALLAATLLTLWVSRGYSDPIRQLVEHSARIERLDTDDALVMKSTLRELSHLAGAQEKMRQALASFARYVPIGVVRDLLAQGAAAEIGGEVRVITVMFSDIKGFTAVAETMTPDELTAQMSEYFDLVVRTLLDHDATVDKFIGDAVMAFWGAPKPMEHHARAATTAVLAAHRGLAKLNARWAEQGRPQLRTRFGIATGPATVGNVGATFRLSYTALGDTVNLAQRLEALNNQTKTWILANDVTKDAAGDGFEWREIGATLVKGRKQYVSVFELVGEAGKPNL